MSQCLSFIIGKPENKDKYITLQLGVRSTFSNIFLVLYYSWVLVSVCVSASVCSLCLPLSLFVCLCLYFSLCVSRCLSLSLFVSLCVSFSIFVSQCVSLSVFVFICLSLSLYLSLCSSFMIEKPKAKDNDTLTTWSKVNIFTHLFGFVFFSGFGFCSCLCFCVFSLSLFVSLCVSLSLFVSLCFQIGATKL